MVDHSSQLNTEEEDRPYIRGSVLHVIFRNDDNGYTVAKVKVKKAQPSVEGDTVTVVGFFPVIEPEETYEFEGSFKEHPRFGKQLQAESYRKDIPTEEEAVISYLASDRFTGIGKKTAASIVQSLGNDAINKILDNPDVLREVQGLNEKKRTLLFDQLMETQGMERAMLLLTRYGFGLDLAVKVYNTYKDQTLETVQSNPYQLVWDVEGIGFHKADKLGRKMGIKDNNIERIKAGVLYGLYEHTMQDGHVYMPQHLLEEKSVELLSEDSEAISKDEVWNGLLELAEDGKVAVEDERAYITSLYFAEKGFVTNVRRLLTKDEEDPFPEAEFLKALGEAEERFSIEYENQQREAIQKAIHSPLMVLTGGPGTGKTTVIRAIVEIFASLHGYSLEQNDYKNDEPFPVLLAAPTGRAAKRMKESTGLPATTIHKLLGYKGEAEEEGFEKSEEQQLEGKLLIIDEVSMVDMWLANQLFKAVPDDMQVILVGDEDQLPSVGPGQVLGDLIHSECVPVVSLSVVYRQAEGSSIIDLAHIIKNGEFPEKLEQPKSDRRFFPCGKHQVAQVIEQVCEGAVRRGYKPKEIQVLAPMYRGPAGVDMLNESLQELFNPAKEGKREVLFGEKIYRTGDVVLQLVNNPEEQVFNGDRGEIVAIFTAKETVDKQIQIVISFDGIEVTYTKQDLKQITLAYCSSIHKAQGSEFPIVVLPMVMSYRRMLRRNLIYTAVTRAKDYLILCGESRALEFGISQHNKDSRLTRLKEKLQEALLEDTHQHE